MRPAWGLLLLLLASTASHAATDPNEISVGFRGAGTRDALARVAFAEAGNQGDSGLAAVVYTILNRLAAGTWGHTVEAVVNARGQFEPVTRVGGDWRNLPAATPAQRARIDTILNLALEGRLPDLTGGALYFQNPTIVAARATAGSVSPRLVNFGGRTPTARIGDHAFYGDIAAGAIPPRRRRNTTSEPPPSPLVPGPRPQDGGAMPGRGLFVLADGRVVEQAVR